MKILGFEAVVFFGINALALLNDIGIISRSFEFELKSETSFDLILCGNFFNSESIKGTFAEHFNIAKWPLSWMLNETTVTTLNLSSQKHPTLFFMVARSEKLLYQLTEMIGSMYSARNTSRPIPNRRIFFLPWPTEIHPGFQSILEQLQSNEELLQSTLFLRQDVEVYILIWTTDDSGHKIITDAIEVYSIRSSVPMVQSVRNVELNLSSIENSTYVFPIDIEDLLRISVRRNDFSGVLFSVVAQPDEFYKPEVNVVKLDNGSVYFESGSSLQVFYDLMRTLNFTYQPVEGKGWTKRVHINGKETLAGIGQQVMDFEADLCISTSTMEDYRAKFISFLQPIGSEQSFVFFRQPSITSARNIFMMPFQLELWYSVFAAWVVIMVCGFFVALRRPQVLRHIGTSRMYSTYQPQKKCFHCRDAYIWSIGAACQQGWFGCPAQLPVRILFITGLFANLLIYAYYTAAFVATISAPTTLIKTYMDLFKTQFTVLVNPNDPGYILSFTRTNSDYNAILAASEKLYKNDEDMVNQIMLSKSRIATIIGQDGFYSVGLEKYSVTELCEIDKRKGNDGPKVKDAMMIRKGSPYKEYFQHSTVMLIERGLAKRSWITYEINTQIRCLPNTSQAFELDFLDCYTAFVILIFGQVFACCWALFERHRKHGFLFSCSWIQASFSHC